MFHIFQESNIASDIKQKKEDICGIEFTDEDLFLKVPACIDK